MLSDDAHGVTDPKASGGARRGSGLPRAWLIIVTVERLWILLEKNSITTAGRHVILFVWFSHVETNARDRARQPSARKYMTHWARPWLVRLVK